MRCATSRTRETGSPRSIIPLPHYPAAHPLPPTRHQVDASVCSNYTAFSYYFYGGYALFGLVFLAVLVLKCLNARKGSFKKAIGVQSSMY